jgi:hypothetical protein
MGQRHCRQRRETAIARPLFSFVPLIVFDIEPFRYGPRDLGNGHATLWSNLFGYPARDAFRREVRSKVGIDGSLALANELHRRFQAMHRRGPDDVEWLDGRLHLMQNVQQYIGLSDLMMPTASLVGSLDLISSSFVSFRLFFCSSCYACCIVGLPCLLVATTRPRLVMTSCTICLTHCGRSHYLDSPRYHLPPSSLPPLPPLGVGAVTRRPLILPPFFSSSNWCRLRYLGSRRI